MSKQTTLKKSFECLANGGIVLFPTVMGFGLAATEEKAIQKIYALKNRPLSKPSGIAVTPKLFERFCGSQHKKIATLINYPLGLIDFYNDRLPILNEASSFLKNNNTIAFFINLNEDICNLAELCADEGKVIMVTSANKAGTGNVYQRKHLHKDFLQEVDYIVEGEADYYYHKRGSFEAVTNTLLDLTKGKIQRSGLFANEIAHWAFRKGLLKNESASSPSLNNLPSSVLFLLAYKSKVYDHLPYYQCADWLILDLQDSCPPVRRNVARTLIQQYMEATYQVDKPIFIRCNELDEVEELHKDFSLHFTDRIAGFILPMLRTKEDIETYNQLVIEIEQRCQIPIGHFKFIPIIERSEALINASEIAGASKRNIALIIGHADLFADLGSIRNDISLGMARQQAVVAARAHNLVAIDTPYTNIHDYEGLQEDAHKAKAIGMDAKVALHPNQLDFVNDIFNISQKDYDILKQDIEYYNQTEGGILRNGSNKLLAPPFIKKMKRELNKKIKPTNHLVVNVARPQTIKHTFDPTQLHIGKVINGRIPTTIDAAWVSHWKSLVNNCYRIENDQPFAQQLSYTSRPIPYHALINFALCELVRVYSIHCKYHLGISNVRQIRPAYYDETLKSSMCITSIQATSSKQFTTVDSIINLSNQNGELILQLERRSLFDYFETKQEAIPIAEIFSKKDKSPEQKKVEHNIYNLANKSSVGNLNQLSESSLIAHTTANLIDLSIGSIYCNLFRNSHPIHNNKMRFGIEHLVISGGLTIPIICSIVANDFDQVYQEEILQTSHLNPVKNGDQLGAMSYLLERQQLSEGLYKFKLCTFGIRNIDTSKTLLNLPIPLELFLSKEMRPKDIQRLLLSCCPSLSKKLIVKIIWNIIVAED